MIRLSGMLKISALALGLITGCASVQPFHYYRLQASAPKAEFHMDGRVGLAPVELPVWMDSSQLTWSDGAYQVHRSDGERWGGDVDQLIEQTIIRNLSRQLSGETVSSGPWLGDRRPDYVIHVTLENLILNDHQMALEASWRIENKKRHVLLNATTTEITLKDSSAVMGTNEGENLAKGLSLLLADLSHTIASQLSHIPSP